MWSTISSGHQQRLERVASVKVASALRRTRQKLDKSLSANNCDSDIRQTDRPDPFVCHSSPSSSTPLLKKKASVVTINEAATITVTIDSDNETAIDKETKETSELVAQKQNQKPKSTCRKVFSVLQLIWEKSQLQRVLPVVILIGYTLLGATILMHLESTADQTIVDEKRDYVKVETERLYVRMRVLREKFRPINNNNNNNNTSNNNNNINQTLNDNPWRLHMAETQDAIKFEVYRYALLKYHVVDKELIVNRLHPAEDHNLGLILNASQHLKHHSDLSTVRSLSERTMLRVAVMDFYIQQLCKRLGEIVIEVDNHDNQSIIADTQSPIIGNNQSIITISDQDWKTTKRKVAEALQRFDSLLGLDQLNQWTFNNAMFLAITTYTTIGYGNVSPRTEGGRLAIIIYAVVGIPLMLVILQKMGRVFLMLLQRLWDAFGRLYRWITCKYKGDKEDELPTEAAGTVHEQLRNVPLSLALGVTTAWMFLSAEVFSRSERDWDYFQAFYFVFISFATVGYGDLVPSSDYALYLFSLVFIGLSLVSMTINVIQIKLEMLFEMLWQELMKEYSAGDGQIGAPPGEMSVWQAMRLMRNKRRASSKRKSVESLSSTDRRPGPFKRRNKADLMMDWQRLANMRSKSCQVDTHELLDGVRTNIGVQTEQHQINVAYVAPDSENIGTIDDDEDGIEAEYLGGFDPTIHIPEMLLETSADSGIATVIQQLQQKEQQIEANVRSETLRSCLVEESSFMDEILNSGLQMFTKTEDAKHQPKMARKILSKVTTGDRTEDQLPLLPEDQGETSVEAVIIPELVQATSSLMQMVSGLTPLAAHRSQPIRKPAGDVIMAPIQPIRGLDDEFALIQIQSTRESRGDFTLAPIQMQSISDSFDDVTLAPIQMQPIKGGTDHMNLAPIQMQPITGGTDHMNLAPIQMQPITGGTDHMNLAPIQMQPIRGGTDHMKLAPIQMQPIRNKTDDVIGSHDRTSLVILEPSNVSRPQTPKVSGKYQRHANIKPQRPSTAKTMDDRIPTTMSTTRVLPANRMAVPLALTSTSDKMQPELFNRQYDTIAISPNLSRIDDASSSAQLLFTDDPDFDEPCTSSIAGEPMQSPFDLIDLQQPDYEPQSSSDVEFKLLTTSEHGVKHQRAHPKLERRTARSVPSLHTSATLPNVEDQINDPAITITLDKGELIRRCKSIDSGIDRLQTAPIVIDENQTERVIIWPLGETSGVDDKDAGVLEIYRHVLNEDDIRGRRWVIVKSSYVRQLSPSMRRGHPKGLVAADCVRKTSALCRLRNTFRAQQAFQASVGSKPTRKQQTVLRCSQESDETAINSTFV